MSVANGRGVTAAMPVFATLRHGMKTERPDWVVNHFHKLTAALKGRHTTGVGFRIIHNHYGYGGYFISGVAPASLLPFIATQLALKCIAFGQYSHTPSRHHRGVECVQKQFRHHKPSQTPTGATPLKRGIDKCRDNNNFPDPI